MNAKDKMNKKNKQGAAFTDDGFAMGRQATGFSFTMHHTVTAQRSDSKEKNYFSKPKILYSGKLSRIDSFCRENFHQLLASAGLKNTMPLNFAEKTFVNSHKTTIFAKVFSLKSFPLYDTPRVAGLSFHW